jgi:cyanophycin synthetase
VAALDNFPHERRTIVYSAGDGRRDADIVRQGEQLALAFDRVVLYEDYSASDRAAGEVAALFRRGLAAGKRTVEVLEIADHRQAVEAALAMIAAGELLVIQPEDEDIEQTLEIVRALAIREAAEESGCFLGIDSN